MRDTYGHAITLTLFGESHGAAVGAVVSGLAAGVAVDTDFMASQMEKRRAKGAISTARTEADKVEILSGALHGVATGTALTLQIANTAAHSEDYAKTSGLLRPGHADYTAYAKYHGFQDARGGGHFSGRLTAPLVAAGSIFTKLLASKGVTIATHLLQCAGVTDAAFSADADALKAQADVLNGMDFAVLDSEKAQAMTAAITAAAAEGDSVGGILETVILGLPAGFGEPFFTSVESVLSELLFSMPAVKGVEFGDGFGFASLRGSSANDAFRMRGGKIVTATNRNGGINGGITNGMPILLRTVVKPTPSIYQMQNTVDFETKQNAALQISGRHDPCIVHRARVVQDSLCALGVADLCSMARGTAWQEAGAWNMG
ncbi:MAG: chorismate synthase [Ruthenibacterium sp.]